MKHTKVLIAKLSAAAAILGIAVLLPACDVEKVEEGEAPEVDIDADPGKLPKYDVDAPDVEVDSKEVEVEVPTIDIEPADDDEEGAGDESDEDLRDRRE